MHQLAWKSGAYHRIVHASFIITSFLVNSGILILMLTCVFSMKFTDAQAHTFYGCIEIK